MTSSVRLICTWQVPTVRGLKQITHFNAADLKNAKVGDFEFFNFKGANNADVQGYVVKPVDLSAGQDVIRWPSSSMVVRKAR